MANLKKEKGITALIIAIVLVVAAIAYVIAAGFTTAVFDGEEFEEAVAMAFEKNQGTLSKKALSKVDYVEIASDGSYVSSYFGYDDFLTRRDEYIAEQEKIAEITEANEAIENEADKQPVPEATVKHPVELAKAGIAEISGTELELPDIKFFTGTKVLSLTGAVVNSSDLAPLTKLTEASFTSCQLDTLGFFKNVDLAKVKEINLVSTSIADGDYSVLEPIADKVNITEYGIEMGEDGNYTVVPQTQTLKEKMEAEAKAQEEAEAEDANEAVEAETTEDESADEDNAEVVEG